MTNTVQNDIYDLVSRLRHAADEGQLTIENLHRLARHVDQLVADLIAAMFEARTVTTWDEAAERFRDADPHQLHQVPTSSTGLHRRYGEQVRIRRLELAYHRANHLSLEPGLNARVLASESWVVEHHRDLLEGLPPIGRDELHRDWDAVIARHRRQAARQLRVTHHRVEESPDGTLVAFNPDGVETTRVTTWRTLRPPTTEARDPAVVEQLQRLINIWPEGPSAPAQR